MLHRHGRELSGCAQAVLRSALKRSCADRPAQVAEKPSDPPIVRKYYMHGCSHFLGLDVHDVGEANPVVLPGMVFTVEPGIYIAEEGIGIRLENDVLIGETENIDLLGDVPLLPDDIERLMAR